MDVSPTALLAELIKDPESIDVFKLGASAKVDGGDGQPSRAVYQASPIKWKRSTKVEVERRREVLYDIVKAMKPMTVRQVFYQATVRGTVEKSEAGYSKVQTDLVLMRRAGVLPYGWLADNARWQRKPRTFDSVTQALEEPARLTASPFGLKPTLCRGLAGEGRAIRRHHAGHRHVRRTAHGGSRLCQPELPALGG